MKAAVVVANEDVQYQEVPKPKNDHKIKTEKHTAKHKPKEIEDVRLRECNRTFRM